jgi:hypothetical protein
MGALTDKDDVVMRINDFIGYLQNLLHGKTVFLTTFTEPKIHEYSVDIVLINDDGSLVFLNEQIKKDLGCNFLLTNSINSV